MPPWVKRNLLWSDEATAGLASLHSAGLENEVTAIVAALHHYCESGAAAGYIVEQFSRGRWKGYWRMKRASGERNDLRALFVDAAARRCVFVQRVRRRENAYDDPPR